MLPPSYVVWMSFHYDYYNNFSNNMLFLIQMNFLSSCPDHPISRTGLDFSRHEKHQKSTEEDEPLSPIVDSSNPSLNNRDSS